VKELPYRYLERLDIQSLGSKRKASEKNTLDRSFQMVHICRDQSPSTPFSDTINMVVLVLYKRSLL